MQALLQRLRHIRPLMLHLLTFIDDRDAVRLLQLDNASLTTLDGYHIKASIPYPLYQRYKLHARRLVVTRLIQVPATLSGRQLPRSLTHLALSWKFTQPVPPLLLADKLPSLRHLTWRGTATLQAGSIPDTVTSVEFGWNFNQPLHATLLPSALTHLTLGEKFHQPLSAAMLPRRLTHLTHRGWVASKLELGVLPDTLTHLTLGYMHALDAGVLPASLLELSLGGYGGAIRAGVLPASLLRLTLGAHWATQLPAGVLPASLQAVHFQVRLRWAWRTHPLILASHFPRGCAVTSVDECGETRTFTQAEAHDLPVPLQSSECTLANYYCPVTWTNRIEQWEQKDIASLWK